MHNNEVAIFLLDWLKQISLVLTGIGTVTWPLYLYMKSRSSEESNLVNKKIDQEHELKLLDHERQLKKDSDIIIKIARETFKEEIYEIQRKYIEIKEELARGTYK